MAPNKLNAIFSDDLTFKKIPEVYSQYFVHSKIFKLVRCNDMLMDVTNEDEQENIIRNYHNNHNHKGINETLSHLKREYYFPFMKRKITKTINNCDICQENKYDRNPPIPKFMKTEIPKQPLDIIHIDLYVINGKIIMTVIDKFSRLSAGYTVTSRNSISILDEFKKFVSLFGIPKKVICDKGSEFCANIFKAFCIQFNIELYFTSFQKTARNAPVERLHSTLTEIYRITTVKRKNEKTTLNHDEIIAKTFITYNNAIHSAAKYTPYELFFGRPYNFGKHINNTNEHEYLTKLNLLKETLYSEVEEKARRIVDRNIEKVNIDREEPENINEGDHVFRKQCRRNKLTA